MFDTAFNTGTASAFDMSNIPQYINNALFHGSNIIAAQVILCAFLMMTALLPLMLAKARFEMILIVLFMMVMVLTAIGWLDNSVMVGMLIVLALIGSGIVLGR